jgi:hypothetical protein
MRNDLDNILSNHGCYLLNTSHQALKLQLVLAINHQL